MTGTRPAQPRSRDDVAAMGVVAQANALQLQVAGHKRCGGDAATIPSPGAVQRFREALIDWRHIRDYDDRVLTMRIHETWGQYCLFCWAFYGRDPAAPPPFAAMPPEQQMHGGRVLAANAAEIEDGLLRLRREQERRAGSTGEHSAPNRGQGGGRRLPIYRNRPPVKVFGKALQDASDADLVACACEYAGMLAAIRWISDDRWAWNQRGIMDIEDVEADPSVAARDAGV